MMTVDVDKAKREVIRAGKQLVKKDWRPGLGEI